MHHSSGDHYYPSPHGPKEDRSWSPHMDSYEMMVSGHVSSFAYKKLKIWRVSEPADMFLMLFWC